MANTILVPTDFSSNSMVAAHYALRLADDLKCNVHFLHAHFPLSMAFRTLPRDKKAEERAEAAASESLARFVETLGGIQQGQITHSLAVANLVEAVQAYIADHSVCLVAMSTHGATGTRKNTLGSNTYDIAKSISAPLLVIPENTVGFSRKKVVFFSDYHENDTKTLQRLKSLMGDNSPVPCTLVHILGNDKPVTATDEQRMAAWKMKLEEAVGYAGLATQLVPAKDEVDVVNEIIDKLDADLTLLTFVDRKGFFERLFHKSLAKAIVLNPKTPVLITTA